MEVALGAEPGQTLEALVLRCPKEIQPHLDKIVSTALEYIKHDPNYADDGDEGEPMETDEVRALRREDLENCVLLVREENCLPERTGRG